MRNLVTQLKTTTKPAQDRLSTLGLLRTTLEEWNADNAAHLSAALAYYTIFSIAPLLIIAMAVAGNIFGADALRGRLFWQVQAFTNSEATADLVQSIVKNSITSGTSTFATVVGVIILVYGATGVFSELKNSLNFIWDAPPPKPGLNIRGLVIQRLLTLLMVVVSGLLLLASLIVSTVLAAATQWVDTNLPSLGGYGQSLNFVFFFVITLLVFALIYKYVPDVRIAWRDVWIGAIATALLFSVGRYLISLYLSHSTIQSTYGAAGSLAVLLIWTYYSAQIFFLGAEFTQVYGRTWGSRWREQALLEVEDAPVPVLVVEGVETSPPVVTKPQTRVHNITRPILDLGAAVGILTVVSLINILREPFRNER